jgi:hypothetical protein
MKRFGVLVLLAALLTGAVYAQTGTDVDALGPDFESLVEQLGAEILPNMQQIGVWGQYPGQAVLPETSRFFFTLSGGAILSFSGILSFAEEADNPAFELLDVGGLVNAIISEADSAAPGDAVDFIQGFFPYPVARSAIGFSLPADFEVMVDFSIFPQFVANLASRVDAVPAFELNALRVGGRVRKQILADAPGVPALSVGAGYSLTAFNLGYDFSTLGAISTDIGALNITGDFFLRSRVNSFGLDFQLSKALGPFVPFVGISPYYQFSSFAGGISGFEAYFDFEDGDPVEDVLYEGGEPDTALIDNDLTIVLVGGFDLVFGRTALQVHSSYSVGETWPGVTLGLRFQ